MFIMLKDGQVYTWNVINTWSWFKSKHTNGSRTWWDASSQCAKKGCLATTTWTKQAVDDSDWNTHVNWIKNWRQFVFRPLRVDQISYMNSHFNLNVLRWLFFKNKWAGHHFWNKNVKIITQWVYLARNVGQRIKLTVIVRTNTFHFSRQFRLQADKTKITLWLY